MSSEPAIFQVDRLDLSFTPQPWAFSLERKAEIGVFFAAPKRQVPAIWNGRVLLLRRHHMADGVFSGEYLESDYASFAAWRAWGRPPAGGLRLFRCRYDYCGRWSCAARGHGQAHRQRRAYLLSLWDGPIRPMLSMAGSIST